LSLTFLNLDEFGNEIDSSDDEDAEEEAGWRESCDMDDNDTEDEDGDDDENDDEEERRFPPLKCARELYFEKYVLENDETQTS